MSPWAFRMVSAWCLLTWSRSLQTQKVTRCHPLLFFIVHHWYYAITNEGHFWRCLKFIKWNYFQFVRPIPDICFLQIDRQGFTYINYFVACQVKIAKICNLIFDDRIWGTFSERAKRALLDSALKVVYARLQISM